ncbi:SDR family NAD(P)-dependent oxidoreductase [Lentilactobacillus sp. SPB1-3]|uniref:SDR family NAD(P)-dependent oxidoreductase n=1 Tax=Lentilactobacillus terminaliae TaxID=3003483 RepID=A0ACD5DDM4_9LACO|nr:SDR family NAD(P)-dependent oxidoreductase [Lentilactobacillus sp. SPB1-3]MCZ0977690.1 SDR family NAD(P)-dependent oxidoreductase [Lentilactobacillus sp. SPB1-3]
MKTWFVTGATGGLATSVIKKLLKRGDRVAATTHREGALADLKSQYGNQLWETTMDLKSDQDIHKVVDKAFTELGTIDVLLNNAAYGLYGAVEGISAKQVEDVFEVNLFGSLSTVRAFMPHFREQGHGHIVQISSMAGEYSTQAMGMYSSSKWAVEAAFEALASEVEPFNVQTTIVEPGGIRTNFVGGNGVFGADLPAYNGMVVDQITHQMKGDVPGIDVNAYIKMIAGDPRKMADQIIRRVDEGKGALRMALGSDAYKKIHDSLSNRLTALEAQKDIAYSTDADDYQG